MPTAAAKLCTICNRDCSDRPRVKDEFNRYTCRSCLDARTESSNTAAISDGDDGINLKAAAMIEAKSNALDLPESQSCPKCHNYFADCDRLCMRCGFDRKRGAKVLTRVEKVKAEKERRRASFDPIWVVLALGIPAIGTGVWAFTDAQMSWVFSLSYGLFSLITSVAVLVAQVRDAAYGYVALMAIYIASFILPIIAVASGSTSGLVGSAAIVGVIGLVCGICQLYWVFAESGRSYLQTAWCMCIVMRLMSMGLNFAAAASASQ